MVRLTYILFVLYSASFIYAQTVLLDGSAISRRFDGIGGLSGGGATSRLLVDYPEPYRSQILDYLFKPYFGASLHILKVEIGGDCQTTDGTEPSHMHTRDDLNFKRGYEWWLLVEAKKRNPDILLYALSWGVPGWVGNGNYFSDDNVDYHVKFLQGAKEVYNLTIDYVGIWNERAFTDDKNCTYIKKLRAGMDAAGFTHTKIVAGDGDWSIVNYLETDPDLKNIVDVVGVHYPGTNSPQNAQNLGTALWASEDYSSFSNNVGDGCWSRILNQNWVNGYMTSTISWDLIAAYYPGLPFGGDGLSWSWFPWTGYYQITGTVWGAAHTTQFAFPGWNYLKHGSGSGHLPKGGSYVTLVPPNNSKGDFSLVIETMTHDNSVCIRPNLPPYTVEKQTVTFQVSNLNLQGPFAVWYSHFSANESEIVYFKRLPDVRPKNGQFSLNLDLDSIFTVTSTSGQNKGSYPNPPSPGPFPLPYSDDFESYPVDSEARYFADQTGVWEIYQGSQSKTMRQVVLQPPIVWCGESSSPISLIGSAGLSDIAVESDVFIESSGTATVGGRVANGGCGNNYNSGYFFSVNSNKQWTLSAGTKVLRSGSISNWKSGFNTIMIQMTGQNISAHINNDLVVSVIDGSFNAGYAAIGSSYNYVQFDNFKLTAQDVNCGSGNLVVIAPCSTDNTRQQWVFNSKDGTIRQRNSINMCLSLRGKDPHTGAPAAAIAECTSDPSQIWVFSSNAIINKATAKCLDIAGQNKSPCADVELWDCNGGLNQSWQYTDSGLILTTLDGSCLSLGSQQ